MRRFLGGVMLWLTLAQAASAAGFQLLSVPDPGNPPIEVGVWYPGDAPPSPQLVAGRRMNLALNAPLAAGRHALIVMSHGRGGMFAANHDTAEALADAGFVAAALTHTGDNTQDHSRSLRIEDRSRQLHVVIDYLLSASPFAAGLDPGRVGAFGFSAGGFTVLVAAGGVPDMSLIGPHCASYPEEHTCRMLAHQGVDVAGLAAYPPGVWVHDPRIRAVVVAAPALGYTFTREGLAGLHAAMQLWRAEDDHNQVQPFSAQAVYDAMAVKPEYHVVPGADHTDFLAPSNDAMAGAGRLLCAAGGCFDRATFHAAFDRDVVRFFGAALGAR